MLLPLGLIWRARSLLLAPLAMECRLLCPNGRRGYVSLWLNPWRSTCSCYCSCWYHHLYNSLVSGGLHGIIDWATRVTRVSHNSAKSFSASFWWLTSYSTSCALRTSPAGNFKEPSFPNRSTAALHSHGRCLTTGLEADGHCWHALGLHDISDWENPMSHHPWQIFESGGTHKHSDVRLEILQNLEVKREFRVNQHGRL